jgi:hypothetical protein
MCGRVDDFLGKFHLACERIAKRPHADRVGRTDRSRNDCAERRTDASDPDHSWAAVEAQPSCSGDIGFRVNRVEGESFWSTQLQSRRVFDSRDSRKFAHRHEAAVGGPDEALRKLVNEDGDFRAGQSLVGNPLEELPCTNERSGKLRMPADPERHPGNFAQLPFEET